MQKTDAKPQPPTICRRLVNMLSTALRPAPSRPIPVENGSSVQEESSFKSINKRLSSDIVVEFRHTDLEGNKASVRASKKGDLILGDERSIIRKIPEKQQDGLSHSPQQKDDFQIQKKTGRKDQEKELQDLEILNGTYSQFKRPEKSIPIQESVDHPAGQAMKQNQMRPLIPLLRVDSDINEQSHKFIETRKEAMRKDFHHDNN